MCTLCSNAFGDEFGAKSHIEHDRNRRCRAQTGIDTCDMQSMLNS
jgi:hypothetical protein